MKQIYHFILFFIFLFPSLNLMGQSWEEEASSDASEPTARHENAFVEANGKLYLLGGRHSRPVNEYDPVAGTWTEKSTPPMQMHHFQAVSWNGKIYILGAFTGDFPSETPVPNVYIYDPAADTWTEGPEIPVARRRGSTGAVLYNGKIYVVGGITDGHNSGAVSWFDEFDPQTGTWVALADAPQARDHFHVAVVNGKLVAAGGRTTSYATGQLNNLTVNTADVYDFATANWATIQAPIPTPRAGAAVAAKNNELLVIGGESASQHAAHNETEALNIVSGSWRILSPLLTGRHGTQAIAFGDVLYIAAGSKEKGGNASTELTSLEVLNISVLTGNSDQQMESVSVTPNPTAGILSISKLPEGIYKIKIFDPVGNKVSHTELLQGKVDISRLNPGVYYLTLFDNNESKGIFRVIKY